MNRAIFKAQRGFGLMEILVTVLILSVGVLGVIRFQSHLLSVSSDNKTEAEAIALAQERIEELRNYGNTYKKNITDPTATGYNDDDNFQTALVAEADEEISGVNALFTREETIATDGTNKNVTVTVSWTDANNLVQSVALDTQLTWVSPRSAGDREVQSNTPTLVNPTGRAHLGDGLVPDGVSPIENDDGTGYWDDGDNRKLTLNGRVVLTLEDACLTETCLDFVKISGKVYIDRALQNSLPANEVYVVASDAAFCQRYYFDSSDKVQTIDTSTGTVNETTNGDYEYFHYTCYIGGGWHGNIGLLLADGIAQSDKFCLGDPTATEEDEIPVITARRAYRGMAYKEISPGVYETYLDSNGEAQTRYYSIGIADSTVLPGPGEGGHDFVITQLAASQNDGAYCISEEVMVRADAKIDVDGDGTANAGELFTGVPSDFVCLNKEGLADESQLTDDMKINYISGCPYDPTNPPVAGYTLSGTIAVTSDETSVLSTFAIDTSDGRENCVLEAFPADPDADGRYSADYTCQIYDWGDGWTGYLKVTADPEKVACASNPRSFSDVKASDSNIDFSCFSGNIAQFSGSVVTSLKNTGLTSVTISDTTYGSCTVDLDGLGYQCYSAPFADGETWTGSITFETNKGTICNVEVNAGVKSYYGIEPGDYTLDLNVANNCN